MIDVYVPILPTILAEAQRQAPNLFVLGMSVTTALVLLIGAIWVLIRHYHDES